MGFNAITYVEELEKAGVPEKQAKTHVRLLSEIINADLATKKGLKELELKIENVRAEFKSYIKSLELRLVFWNIIILGAFISALKIFSL